MRRFITVILTITMAYTLNAQIEKRSKLLEPAIWEGQYQLVKQLDTLGTATVTDTTILRIGKNISQYYACSAFRIDSLLCSPGGSDILQKQMMDAIKTKKPIPGPRITNEYHYKNRKTDTITTYVERQSPLIFDEAYEKQAWIQTGHTKNILGYSCHSASCRFRGRDYVAWYTTEIDLPEGPWKFGGLPGLIVEVYDTKHHYHFTLIGIKKGDLSPIYFYRTSTKEPEKTTREAYLKIMREAYEQVKARKKEAINYDLLERDYH